jgi:hypothetical protein
MAAIRVADRVKQPVKQVVGHNASVVVSDNVQHKRQPRAHERAAKVVPSRRATELCKLHRTLALQVHCLVKECDVAKKAAGDAKAPGAALAKAATLR